jgi:hypothetical protein
MRCSSVLSCCSEYRPWPRMIQGPGCNCEFFLIQWNPSKNCPIRSIFLAWWPRQLFFSLSNTGFKGEPLAMAAWNPRSLVLTWKPSRSVGKCSCIGSARPSRRERVGHMKQERRFGIQVVRLGVLSCHHCDRSLRGGPILRIGNIFDYLRTSLALLAAVPFAWSFFLIECRS